MFERFFLWHPFYYLIGYIFMWFKYRDEKERKLALKKQYDDSYSIVGKILMGQAFAGVLIILFGGVLIIFIGSMIYHYAIKPLLD